jgi:hypothetical protein
VRLDDSALHHLEPAPASLEVRPGDYVILGDYVIERHGVFVFVYISADQVTDRVGGRPLETRRASAWDAPPPLNAYEPRTNDSAVTLSLAAEVVA